MFKFCKFKLYNLFCQRSQLSQSQDSNCVCKSGFNVCFFLHSICSSAPPPPKRAPTTALSMRSKSMTSELEELGKRRVLRVLTSSSSGCRFLTSSFSSLSLSLSDPRQWIKVSSHCCTNFVILFLPSLHSIHCLNMWLSGVSAPSFTCFLLKFVT